MIYVVEAVSGYGNLIVTTNFSQALSKTDCLRQDAPFLPITIEIWLPQGTLLDKFIISAEQTREEIEKDFVLFAIHIAKKTSDMEVIRWAECISKDYDYGNPTIKSLLYSLYEKYQRNQNE